MNVQKYILTILNSSIFREVDVYPDTSPLKIGTLQDCDVRLKRELFAEPVCVTLLYGEGEWRAACAEGLCIHSPSVKDSKETVIRHGDIIEIHSAGSGAVLFSMSFSYDFTLNSTDFDTIVDVRNISRLVIGNSPDAQIKLESAYIGSEYITLDRRPDGGYDVDAGHAPASATLNGIRLFGKAQAGEYDFIGIADYSFYFKNQVLYTAKREDMRMSGISSQPLREETPAFDYPKLNRSPRMLYDFDTRPVEILNPPQKPDKPRDNLVLQLSPALLMMAVTVLTRSGLIGGTASGNPTFLIFSVATMAVGIVTSVISFIHNRKRYEKDLAEWNQDYAAYVSAKRQEIEAGQDRERSALNDIYPGPEKERDFVKTFSGRLFERSLGDADFLHVRAGLGAVPAKREITYQQEEHVKVENELMSVPVQLHEEYSMIKDAPVLLHLREAGAVGVIGSTGEQYAFFKSMLLDI